MIRFLFKSCVILCLLFIALSYFIPVKSQTENSAADQENSAGILAAAAAFGAFITDMDGFCRRSPQSCATGKSLFGLMGEKAGQGAGLAYQWLGASLHQGAENTDRHLSAPNADAPAAGAAKTPQAAETAAADKTQAKTEPKRLITAEPKKQEGQAKAAAPQARAKTRAAAKAKPAAKIPPKPAAKRRAKPQAQFQPKKTAQRAKSK